MLCLRSIFFLSTQPGRRANPVYSMRTKYFHNYPGDGNRERGREITDWQSDPEPMRRVRGIDVQQAILLERTWAAWVDDEYVVGPDCVASWEDRPMGFAMFKVKSLGAFLDRCAIENTDDPGSYALFDLWTKRANGTVRFHVYDVKEFQFTVEDETLIRLAI